MVEQIPLYHAPCLLPDACLSNVFHQTRFVKDSRSFHSDFLWNYHCVERYTLQDEAYRAVTMVGLYWIFMVAFTQRVIRNHLDFPLNRFSLNHYYFIFFLRYDFL